LSRFASLLVSGLSIGCVYGLVALGFVIIFKATKVVNFAHAVVAATGAYVVGKTHDELGFGVALLLGVAFAAALSAAIELVLRGARRPDPARLSIITLGVGIVVGAELRREMGPTVYATGDPWGTGVVDIGSVTIPQTRIAAAVTALAVMALFALAFRLSGWGIAMRAASEDAEAAALMGIRLRRVSTGAWLVAGALATVAGIFLAAFPGGGVTSLTELAVLGAFPAAIVGGLDSPPGAVVGGLLIGVATTLATGYQNEIAFLGRGVAQVVPYAVMFVVLLVRPAGIFGTRDISRV
jgi:branched-chain amino acid transport system permease protein